MGDSEKVVSVVGRRENDVANADAVACLETWLERVRSGEVTSVAIAGIGPGRAEFGHSSYVDERLIGATTILQHELIVRLAED